MQQWFLEELVCCTVSDDPSFYQVGGHPVLTGDSWSSDTGII